MTSAQAASLPVDASVRGEALDCSRSFIVQAPAGSGKTSLLIDRYICLLDQVREPEEVLAITFTIKATHEMKQRVLEVLAPGSRDLHQAAANDALRRVRERAGPDGWDLLNQPSRMQIMTIDALCAKLVRAMPWASRFGSVPSVADSEKIEEYYRVAARSTVEFSGIEDDKGRLDLKQLLGRLDNRTGKLEEMIVDMLRRRDQWLEFIASFPDAAEDGNEYRAQLEKVWQQVVSRSLEELLGAFDPAFLAETLELGRYAAGNLDETYRKKSAMPSLMDALPASMDSVVSLPQWRGVAELLLTGGNEWRKQVNKRNGFPPPNDPSDERKKQMVELLGKLRADDRLRNSLAHVRSLPDPWYVESDWKCLRAIISVLQVAVSHLSTEFRNRGQADFIEMAQKATAALGDEQLPTDLSMVLEYQYGHILIDEFQDVSVSQRNLIRRLVACWEADAGRTLFAVGDPMQSIYRFREAEVGIFVSAFEEGEFAGVSLTPLRLTQNFRSTPELVDWYNATFSEVFPEESDSDFGAVRYSPAEAHLSSSSRGASLWLQSRSWNHGPESVRQAEAERLASDLHDYLERAGEGEKAAILVRSRAHLKAILPELRSAGIEFRSEEIDKLDTRPVVSDLLSLTRALLRLEDRVAWLAILRAPWCGLDLGDLLTIAEARESPSIWQAMRDDAVVERLSKDGQARLARSNEALERVFASRGRYGLRQWVEDAWTILGGPACVEEHDRANARLLLDMIERYATGAGVENLHGFEKYLESTYAVQEISQSDQAVQVMTMHSAKGLEFDAVFIPCLDKRPRSDTKPLYVWSSAKWGGSPEESLLVSPVYDAEDDLMYEYLWSHQSQASGFELDRLLYVACTRAKRELYLYGCVAKKQEQSQEQENGDDELTKTHRPPGEGTMLSRLLTGVEVSPDSLVEVPDREVAAESGSTQPSLFRLPADWTLPPAPAPVMLPDSGRETPDQHDSIDFDWAGDIARWIGLVVHEWLHKISLRGVEHWDKDLLLRDRNQWRVRLMSMGVGDDQLQEAHDRVQNLLLAVLEDDRARWILSGSHPEARSEWKLTGVVNGDFRNLALDRTFVEEKTGVRWIVDYKTGYGKDVEKFLDDEQKRYEDQLNEYGEFVSRMESRPIRLGLYFPALKGWREWPY